MGAIQEEGAAMRVISTCIAMLLVLLAYATPTAAETTCSPGMIAHTYGIVGHGMVPGQVFCGISGIITIKKNGNTNGRVKLSCNGQVEVSTGTGTINVRPNCTADADLTFNDGTTGSFHFTIVDGGKKLVYVGEQHTPPLSFVGVGERL